jgi:hypothetical protein
VLSGAVRAMTVAADWRRKVHGSLPDAVRAVIQAATADRLEAWANAMNDPSAEIAPATEPDLQAPRDFAVRLQEAVTAHGITPAGPNRDDLYRGRDRVGSRHADSGVRPGPARQDRP